MKLNLHILKEDLKDLDLKGRLPDAPWVLRCSFPTACAALPPEFQENVLYLLPAELLAEEPRFTGCPSLLCIGTPPDAWLDAPCNLLYTEARPDLLALLNRVTRLFAGYQQWEDGLQEILDQNQPLREMALHSHSLLHNSIFVQGTAFQVLISAIPSDAEDTPLLQYYRKNYAAPEHSTLAPEDVNMMISDSEYNRAIEAPEPAIYSGALYGFRTLFYNIRVNGVFVARICVDEVVTPFTSRDFALIKILGQYLAKGLSRENIYYFNRPKDMDAILHSLLSHRLLPEEKIHQILTASGWNMNDSYLCLILKLKTRDDTSSALTPLALSLARLLCSECYTVFNGAIVFVCNLSASGMDEEQLFSHVLPYLRDNLLTAGISAVYRDFKDLYYYYTQTERIFRLGEQKEPTKWYFRFEDYQMDYIISKLKEKNVTDALIPAGLQRLLEYDAKKGTDYARLLCIFLDKERNIAETIRAAFLHRNTFLYRIQKIRDILQMDLDQPHIRLILMLAFRVLGMSDDDAGTK